MSNLASRKVLFDKQKGEILEKINGSFLCTATIPTEQMVGSGTTVNGAYLTELKQAGIQATAAQPYALGAEYLCNLGDGSRNFYVLKEDGNNVKLIMNENLGDSTTWCISGSSNSCAADGAKTALIDRTSGWTKLFSVGGIVELPEAQDLADAIGDNEWTPSNGTGMNGLDWMNTNLDGNNGPYGYWTSSASAQSYNAWSMYHGKLSQVLINTSFGIRPVIIVPKSYLSL